MDAPYAGPTPCSFPSPASLQRVGKRRENQGSEVYVREIAPFFKSTWSLLDPLYPKFLKASVSEARLTPEEPVPHLASTQSPHQGAFGELSTNHPLERMGGAEVGEVHPETALVTCRQELTSLHSTGPAGFRCHTEPGGQCQWGHPDPGLAAAPAHPVTSAVTSLVWVPLASVIK